MKRTITLMLFIIISLTTIDLALDFPLILGELPAGEIMKKLPEYKEGFTKYKPDEKIKG